VDARDRPQRRAAAHRGRPHLRQRVRAVAGDGAQPGFFLGPTAGGAWGATAGALAGVGWAASSLAVIYLFERRSLMLILIDGGYQAVAFTAMGAILGAWPA
jgi:hypothetical protein